ncbi:recombinase family protein [Rhizobium nepotum]|uniref:recombinase family protein n=1 Tax=Rhizobium nepotum TaxID=1035271 RepID=UPI000AC9149D|nr:recombinase family protein [Rhizobium nepotum]
MMHEKISAHHLERKAILYVRQSSAHQVLHNRESSALQYAMRDRLTALGWSQIETVDEDLGRSAAGGVTRAGFDRMVAEVCLGKVGAVAAREVSRFDALRPMAASGPKRTSKATWLGGKAPVLCQKSDNIGDQQECQNRPGEPFDARVLEQ